VNIRTISGSSGTASTHQTVATAVNAAMANVTLKLDGASSAQFLDGKVVRGIANNAGAVTNAVKSEPSANRGRRELVAAQTEPSTLIR